jgi:hypothetical protein
MSTTVTRQSNSFPTAGQCAGHSHGNHYRPRESLPSNAFVSAGEASRQYWTRYRVSGKYSDRMQANMHNLHAGTASIEMKGRNDCCFMQWFAWNLLSDVHNLGNACSNLLSTVDLYTRTYNTCTASSPSQHSQSQHSTPINHEGSNDNPHRRLPMPPDTTKVSPLT